MSESMYERVLRKKDEEIVALRQQLETEKALFKMKQDDCINLCRELDNVQKQLEEAHATGYAEGREQAAERCLEIAEGAMFNEVAAKEHPERTMQHYNVACKDIAAAIRAEFGGKE